MFFEDDLDTHKLLVSNIINQRSSAIEMAGRFILELSEDIKRLNQNTYRLMCMGIENTNKYIFLISDRLGVSLGTTTVNSNKLLK